jgi:hypothetical protein
MNQDIRDALARLTHALENEARANGLLHTRLAEQEAIAARERERADTAMLQIRDAHNALHAAGIDAEPHEAHEGCATQLGHRVRLLAAREGGR